MSPTVGAFGLKKSLSKSPVHKRHSRSRSRSPSRRHKRPRSSRPGHGAGHSRRSRSRSHTRRSKKKIRRRSRSRSPGKRSSKTKHRSRSRSKGRRSKSHRSRSRDGKRPKRRRKSRSRSHSSSPEAKLSRVGSESKFRAIPEVAPPVEAKAAAISSHSDAEQSSVPGGSPPHSRSEGNASSEEETEKGESSEIIAVKNGDKASTSPTTSQSPVRPPTSEKIMPVSTDLLSKVRAMLKASRETVLKEDLLETQLPAAPIIPPQLDSDQEEGETDSS